VTAVLVLFVLALLLPPVLRGLRLLFVAHLWAVLLFLPAGLLLRSGSEDLRVLALVTAVWGCLLAVLPRRACARRS
jgi:hypothetical protein